MHQLRVGALPSVGTHSPNEESDLVSIAARTGGVFRNTGLYIDE